MTAYHEDTKSTKHTRNSLYTGYFVGFVSLRAFVMNRS